MFNVLLVSHSMCFIQHITHLSVLYAVNLLVWNSRSLILPSNSSVVECFCDSLHMHLKGNGVPHMRDSPVFNLCLYLNSQTLFLFSV